MAWGTSSRFEWRIAVLAKGAPERYYRLAVSFAQRRNHRDVALRLVDLYQKFHPLSAEAWSLKAEVLVSENVGQFIRKDLARAAALFQKACRSGYANACDQAKKYKDVIPGG
jgi:TPR repeat protein